MSMGDDIVLDGAIQVNSTDGEKTKLLYPQIRINGEDDPKTALIQPVATPPLQLTQVFGYLSFSVVFNVMNTIIYGTLYPKLLEMTTPNHTQVFANTNTASTLCSALLLPLIGSVTDQLGTLKVSLLVCQYMGLLVTYGFLLLNTIPEHTQVLWVEIIYIIAMFLLRTCVMNNNAQIASFPPKYRTTLSLLNNLVGFIINLGGLLLLRFAPLNIPTSWGLNTELCWVAIFVTFVTLVSPLVFFSPKPLKKDVATRPTFLIAFKQSVLQVAKTLKELCLDVRYRGVFYFLLAYVFFSCSGSMFTIYISTFFIKVYNLSTPNEVLLNLYYKVAMIVGTAIGMGLDRFVKINEVKLLVFQSIVYLVCEVMEYITITSEWSVFTAYCWAMIIGANYAWNMGVARGLMSKIMPTNKSGEFMALYSTATYLPITVLSLAYSSAMKAGLSATILPLLLAIFILPAFGLLYKTNQFCKNVIS